MAFDSHYARLIVWAQGRLFGFLLTQSFHLPFNVFSFPLHTRLGLPYPLAFEVIRYIYG
jgi:hypothetical protein